MLTPLWQPLPRVRRIMLGIRKESFPHKEGDTLFNARATFFSYCKKFPRKKHQQHVVLEYKRGSSTITVLSTAVHIYRYVMRRKINCRAKKTRVEAASRKMAGWIRVTPFLAKRIPPSSCQRKICTQNYLGVKTRHNRGRSRRLFETTASIPKRAKPSTFKNSDLIRKNEIFLQISLDIH